jgi:hypothetical protein
VSDVSKPSPILGAHMFDLTKHKQGSPFPALAVLAVALAACAPMNPEIQQEKLRAQSINEFVKYRFPVKAHSVPAGSGEYLAYFNEVNSSDLYSPKKDLGRYCQAKMGTLSVVATSGANPIVAAKLPTATHITSGQERVRERQRLLDAYATAIGNGCSMPMPPRSATARWERCAAPRTAA